LTHSGSRAPALASGRDADGQLARAAVRAQLQRILDSPAFEASERRRRFLRHIVEESLAGRADRLKGYSIATAIFERDASFDPQTDPVVRLEARRLRRALEHYYLTAGRNDPIRIEIPKGGYAPICEPRAGEPTGTSGTLSGALDPAGAPTRQSGQVRLRRRWLTAAGVGLALGAALAVAVTTGRSWLTGATPDRDLAQNLPDVQLTGPAVVVAPFENLSGTEAGHLFAGGLTQELITNLMRFQDLRVYSANSNARWTKDRTSFAKELQVAYEVNGSVLRAPGRIRLAVQLLDLGSGRYVWSEIYDRPLTAATIFDLQEEIAAELAGRLAEPYGVIHEVTADQFRRHRPDTLFAYDCVLQAFGYRRTYERALYLRARACLEQAVRDDPDYPAAWAMLAFALLDEYRWYGWGPMYAVPAALDQALAAAQRALELDPDDVMTLSAYSAVQFYRSEFACCSAAQQGPPSCPRPTGKPQP
jgi:adenylate cyclase